MLNQRQCKLTDVSEMLAQVGQRQIKWRMYPMQLLFLRSEKSEDSGLASLQQSGYADKRSVRSALRDRGADEPVPPHFALDLFALAGGDAFLLIVEIHWTDFFRITPILWC